MSLWRLRAIQSQKLSIIMNSAKNCLKTAKINLSDVFLIIDWNHLFVPVLIKQSTINKLHKSSKIFMNFGRSKHVAIVWKMNDNTRRLNCMRVALLHNVYLGHDLYLLLLADWLAEVAITNLTVTSLKMSCSFFLPAEVQTNQRKSIFLDTPTSRFSKFCL